MALAKISTRDVAYDTNFSSSGAQLRGLDILAAGTLFIVDSSGNARTYDYSSLTVPQRLWLAIEQIVGDGAEGAGDGVTGTDIPLASLIGLVEG